MQFPVATFTKRVAARWFVDHQHLCARFTRALAEARRMHFTSATVTKRVAARWFVDHQHLCARFTRALAEAR